MARTALRMAAARMSAEVAVEVSFITMFLRLQSVPRGAEIRSRDGPSSNRRTLHPSTDGLAHHDRHDHRRTHASSVGTRAEFRIRTLVVCSHSRKARALLRHYQAGIPRPATQALSRCDEKAPGR